MTPVILPNEETPAPSQDKADEHGNKCYVDDIEIATAIVTGAGQVKRPKPLTSWRV